MCTVHQLISLAVSQSECSSFIDMQQSCRIILSLYYSCIYLGVFAAGGAQRSAQVVHKGGVFTAGCMHNYASKLHAPSVQILSRYRNFYIMITNAQVVHKVDRSLPAYMFQGCK